MVQWTKLMRESNRFNAHLKQRATIGHDVSIKKREKENKPTNQGKKALTCGGLVPQ
jgi:hypothetical protein